MSYFSVCLFHPDDIIACTLSKEKLEDSIQAAIRQIVAYHEHAALLLTEAEILLHEEPWICPKDLYRMAYWCENKAIQILDAYYGFIFPSGKFPISMTELVDSAAFCAELIGGVHVTEMEFQLQ